MAGRDLREAACFPMSHLTDARRKPPPEQIQLLQPLLQQRAFIAEPNLPAWAYYEPNSSGIALPMCTWNECGNREAFASGTERIFGKFLLPTYLEQEEDALGILLEHLGRVHHINQKIVETAPHIFAPYGVIFIRPKDMVWE